MISGSKTGWAVLKQDGSLVEYGVISDNKTLKDYNTPYPANMVVMADSLVTKMMDLVVKYDPSIIVIEELNKGRATVSQSMLAYLHHEVNRRLWDKYKNTIYPVKYVRSSSWRKTLELKLSKEQKKNNKLVNEINKRTDKNKAKKEAGIKGKVTKKHLSIKYANNHFNLSLKTKDDDIADALNLALAYIKGCEVFTG